MCVSRADSSLWRAPLTRRGAPKWCTTVHGNDFCLKISAPWGVLQQHYPPGLCCSDVSLHFFRFSLTGIVCWVFLFTLLGDSGRQDSWGKALASHCLILSSKSLLGAWGSRIYRTSYEITFKLIRLWVIIVLRWLILKLIYVWVAALWPQVPCDITVMPQGRIGASLWALYSTA